MQNKGKTAYFWTVSKSNRKIVERAEIATHSTQIYDCSFIQEGTSRWLMWLRHIFGHLWHRLWCLTHFQHYFSHCVAVSFIDGGKRSTRRKPPNCRKSLTIVITKRCIERDSNSWNPCFSSNLVSSEPLWRNSRVKCSNL